MLLERAGERLAVGDQEEDRDRDRIRREAKCSLQVLPRGGEHQRAILPAQRHDAELPRLTTREHAHHRGIARVEVRNEGTGELGVLLDPGILDQFGSDAEEAFADRSEGFGPTGLFRQDTIDLSFRQDSLTHEQFSDPHRWVSSPGVHTHADTPAGVRTRFISMQEIEPIGDDVAGKPRMGGRGGRDRAGWSGSCDFPDSPARMGAMDDQSPTPSSDPEDRWRVELLEAVAERRLRPGDRRELEHRLETATRRSRRDAVRGEIEVLLRFLAIGASVRAEVEVPGGHPIDFEVTLEDRTIAVHVKRLPTAAAPVPTPSDDFDRLRGIPRPYVVGLAWSADRSPVEGELEDMEIFLRAARMGDRHLVRDDEDGLVGTLEILRPIRSGSETIPNVELVGIADADADDRLVERAGRLLRRAYQQFAPGLENVIVLAGGGVGAERLVDRAILGGHVERWDRLPHRGQRVAHGRDDRGLWTGRHYERSRLVAWAPLARPDGRTWIREGDAPPADAIRLVESAMLDSRD